MNWSDLYSNSPSTGAPVQVQSTMSTGPNQSIVTGGGQTVAGVGGTGAAISWLGLALALIIIRVLISMGGQVA